jgi:two-component system sensor histidine kinase KdpD
MRLQLLSLVMLRVRRPPIIIGLAVAAGGTTLETLAIYPLGHLAPAVSLAVVYVLAVVITAVYWGTALGLLTALASAVAFNYFHLPPVGRFTPGDARTWIAFATLAVVAVMAGLLGNLARARADDAERRRSEADLATEVAALLLGGSRLEVALAATARRVASAIGVSSAALELGAQEGDERRVAFALRDRDAQLGTLLLPATLGSSERERVATRIVPMLQSVLAASLHQAELQAEVVETALLRRSDETKTAVLRSVSHDLRTPLTAVLTAATALDPHKSGAAEAAEAQAVVLEAATRLSRLVEKLLDLSLLQAGTLDQRSVSYSLEDVLLEAAAHVETDGGGSIFRLALDPDLPLLSGDPGQLERAFANLLENAARYSPGKPVSVRAHAVGERVRVRIVDQGPGIRASELERIFLPFYRSSTDAAGHQGSGLGLAIARGFIELAGGRISVESLPRQGATFVVELPVAGGSPAVTDATVVGKRPTARIAG